MYDTIAAAIMTALVLLPTLGMIAVGAFMIRSAATGKGLEQPGPDARASTHFQYAIRGFTGLALLAGGILMLVMIFANW